MERCRPAGHGEERTPRQESRVKKFWAFQRRVENAETGHMATDAAREEAMAEAMGWVGLVGAIQETAGSGEALAGEDAECSAPAE